MFLLYFVLKMDILTKNMKYKSIYTRMKKQTALNPNRARLARLRDKRYQTATNRAKRQAECVPSSMTISKRTLIALSVQPPILPPLSAL